MYQEISSKEDRSSGISDSNFQISYSIVRNGWSGDAILSSDPNFLDYTNGDYRLSSDSPAIGIGTTAPSRDLLGIKRPYPAGTKPDLGPYEQGMLTEDEVDSSFVSKIIHEQALLDANVSAEQAIADAKASAKEEGIELVKADPSNYGLYSSADLNASIANAKSEGESSVTSNPFAYNLVTQDAYDQMMNDLMSASDANATHYTEDWFYHPSRGWMWTDSTAYPYFYDATDKDWMYFQSGNDKPKFYRYKTKTWLTVE